MSLNKIRFKNGGMYLDDAKVQGIQNYELTDGVNEVGTLKLELLVDGSELFKEQPDDPEGMTVIESKILDILKNIDGQN